MRQAAKQAMMPHQLDRSKLFRLLVNLTLRQDQDHWQSLRFLDRLDFGNWTVGILVSRRGFPSGHLFSIGRSQKPTSFRTSTPLWFFSYRTHSIRGGAVCPRKQFTMGPVHVEGRGAWFTVHLYLNRGGAVCPQKQIHDGPSP